MQSSTLVNKPLSPRTLTISCLVALSIILGLLIVSQLVLSNNLHRNQNTQAFINVSARQRMLSQRIASMAAQYRLGDQGARAELIAAASQFEAANNALSAASSGINDPGPAAALLHQLYFDGPTPLDAGARLFIATARKIAALPPDSPLQAPLLKSLFAQAQAPLLIKLNEVVMIHQRVSEFTLARLQRLELIILGAVLAVLLLATGAIYYPMIKRVPLATGREPAGAAEAEFTPANGKTMHRAAVPQG